MLRDRRSHDIDDNIWIDDQICVLQIYRPYLLLPSRRLRSLHNSRLREFKVSNPTSFLCQSPRVDDLWTPVQLPDQRSFFPFRCLTLQHGSMVQQPSPRSDAQDLLRVFRLLKFQISKLCLSSLLLFGGCDPPDACPLDPMTKDLFGTFTKAHWCMPCLLQISRSRSYHVSLEIHVVLLLL